MATVPLAEWVEVDEYTAAKLIPGDPALTAAIRESEAAGLPEIQVAPNQGKFLHLLARAIQARRILEIGALGGYSGIWLGRALPPGGRMLSLEIDARHAEVARRNLTRAGLGEAVEVRLAPALETLQVLRRERSPPFDFVFIDADKVSSRAYLAWAQRLSRPGALIVVDNVVRGGAVARPDGGDASVRGMREMNDYLHENPGLSATSIQTVGVKGYDGFTIALVLSNDDGLGDRSPAGA